MSDVLDVMYRLRDKAGGAADELRAAIAKAQAVLDRLDQFADDAEAAAAAELAASSDLFPGSYAIPPERSGLSRNNDPKEH